MKKTNLIKGILFIAIAVLFLLVTFYNIYPEITVTSEGDPPVGIRMGIGGTWGFYFNEFFVQTWHNYAFSALFALLGALEIREGVASGD